MTGCRRWLFLLLSVTVCIVCHTSPVKGCNGDNYVVGDIGEIWLDSPAPNDYCFWQIRGTEAEFRGKMTISSVLMDTACGWDSLYVYDGPGVDSPLLGVFSGNESFTVTSTQAYISVHFVAGEWLDESDGTSVRGAPPSRGFRLRYTELTASAPAPPTDDDCAASTYCTCPQGWSVTHHELFHDYMGPGVLRRMRATGCSSHGLRQCGMCADATGDPVAWWLVGCRTRPKVPSHLRSLAVVVGLMLVCTACVCGGVACVNQRRERRAAESGGTRHRRHRRRRIASLATMILGGVGEPGHVMLRKSRREQTVMIVLEMPDGKLVFGEVVDGDMPGFVGVEDASSLFSPAQSFQTVSECGGWRLEQSWSETSFTNTSARTTTSTSSATSASTSSATSASTSSSTSASTSSTVSGEASRSWTSGDATTAPASLRDDDWR